MTVSSKIFIKFMLHRPLEDVEADQSETYTPALREGPGIPESSNVLRYATDADHIRHCPELKGSSLCDLY
ncbi:hypothetical protein TNCV_4642861 [Trichonephila clavipes]|nr:hypothetical protein TNCV_4642861 [Trichonephila clavipes]